MDQTSAILSWNTPKRPSSESYDTKYRSDIVFKVKCIGCNTNAVFNPVTDTFNDTKLTITNLEPVTTYTVQIHSLNSVSYSLNADDGIEPGSNFSSLDTMNNNINMLSSVQSNQDDHHMTTEYAEIIFTTESAIQSAVSNVRIVSITSKEIDLVWDKPLHSDAPIESYEVRWFPKSEVDAVNKSTYSTQESKAHIENLMENSEYGFQVRCKTANGFGTYSNIVYGQTHQSVSPGKIYFTYTNFILLFLFFTFKRRDATHLLPIHPSLVSHSMISLCQTPLFHAICQICFIWHSIWRLDVKLGVLSM